MVAVSGRGWKLAPCLVELFKEADRRDPSRDHSSDGSIGNAEHSARVSDHNPSDDGWVCAGDIDDDDDQESPGVDLLLRHLVASKDPRVKYVIRNGTIWKNYPNRGLPPWAPQVYSGVNAHRSHLHISVWNTAQARNDLRPWWPVEEDDMPLTDADVLKVADATAKVVLARLGLELDDERAEEQAGHNRRRDTLAALFRRVLGVPVMANSAEQHKADEDTGRRFQHLLGDGA